MFKNNEEKRERKNILIIKTCANFVDQNIYQRLILKIFKEEEKKMTIKLVKL
jgi:hypothetical protein